MSRYYQRPENALKKATEFIEVGKPTRALDTLYDVIKGKRHRAFSEKVIEPIMLKYLELCVDLKKPHTAKEGLYQYRLMCQTVNVGLLEKVIRSYIKMAEERTEQARENLKNKASTEQSAEAVVEVDDLENVSVAEMQLLNVITEEQAQERSDRAALIPWVKFLWESYTQCLDLLRNNARLENLYHDIAQMAFKFCLSYQRKTEFRKLCERLRKHFDDIVNRSSTQMNSIDFSSPETQQYNMETRLAQLDSAITMELWQEAYKAIEDIHLLMNQSKKSQTRMMAYYYQKLSLVFWKAGNLLFHAATMLKYYMLCKDMKRNVSQEELQRNASQVVLATLAIPFPVSHPEFERFVETDKGMMEKAQRLATLLFLPQPPTRVSLIRDLSRYNVISNAIPQLQSLHDLLEKEFNPLGLCDDVNRIVQDVISKEENEYLQQYVQPLQDVALVRLIKQVSQVYQSIEYNHLLQMTVFTTQSHLEQLLVDAVRYNDMQITIDHRTNCVKFGASLAEASREDLPEGPHLQDMPSETVRLQLVNVFRCLEDTVDMINPPHIIHEDEILRGKIINHYLLTEKSSHIQRLQRHKIIAERREELERSNMERESKEKQRNEQILQQQQLAEAKRIEAEREEREKRRIEQEAQALKQRRKEDHLKQITASQWGQKFVGKLNEADLAEMDMETVMIRKQEEMAKEAKEHQQRMRAQEKRLDHLERAKRQEEIPVLEKYIKDRKEQEKKEWEVHEKERIANLIEERKLAVAHRERMKRMKRDRDQFLSKLMEARRGEYMAKLADFEKRFADEKARRLEERKQQRKEERRRKWQEEKEEEERQRQEELRRQELQRMKEEREAKALEEREEFERAERKRLERVAELDAKIRAEDEMKQKTRATIAPAAAPSESSGVWRPSRLQAAAQADPAPPVDRPVASADTGNRWTSKKVLAKKANPVEEVDFRRGPPPSEPVKHEREFTRPEPEERRRERDLGDVRREPQDRFPRDDQRGDWRTSESRGGFGNSERSERQDFRRENRNMDRRDDGGFDNARNFRGGPDHPREFERPGTGENRNLRSDTGRDRDRDLGNMRDRERDRPEGRPRDRGGFGGSDRENNWRK